MKSCLQVLLSLAIAAVIGFPPLLAARPGRAGAEMASAPQRQVTLFDRGGQSERQAPDAAAPERPARVDGEPRITPFCEPVPETFFISSLGSIATDLGTAGYVIETSGHYIVTRDLLVPDAAIGILVRARDVILDLNRRTISAAGTGSTIVRIEDTSSITIRDGWLRGGDAGIVALGRAGSNAAARLAIHNTGIQGDGAAYRPIHVTVGQVEMRGVEASGGATGVFIGGHPFNSRIVGSRIESMQVGLRIDHFDGGRLIASSIQAPDAVVIGGVGVRIEDNTIQGGTSGLAALRITEGDHFVQGNRIEANGSAHAIFAGGTGIIEKNDVRGGEESTVNLHSWGTRISNNRIEATSIGISVGIEGNLIEKNRILGDGLQCAIRFRNSDGHVYRLNTFDGGAESVCGVPNQDGGGNTYDGNGLAGGFACPPGPCGAVTTREPGPERSSGRGFPDDPEAIPSKRPRKCEPGEVVAIVEVDPQDTPHGKAGIFIDEPGYYLLTRDLDLESTEIWWGVVIAASDVVFDLGGHTIRIPDSAKAGRIVAGENVIVRNGWIYGGDDGLDVNGSPDSSPSSIRIERMRFGGRFGGLVVGHVDYLELLDSHVYGYSALYETRLARFIGNDMGTEKTGLEARWLDGGVFLNNRIRADYALKLGSGSQLSGNILDGQVKVHGSVNTLDSNVLLPGRDYNIDLSDGTSRNIIRRSIIHGDVELSAHENLLIDSTILRGVFVRGERNRLENNLITGSGCGLNLQTDAGHQYKDNVVTAGREGICGSPNDDRGGNITPPPTCGNGYKALAEICETPYQTGDYRCGDFGFEGGTLRCNDACDGFDAAYCHTCGDGIQQPLESCDGSDMRGQTCGSFGFDGGTLACGAQCSFDKTGCVGGCGNGILEEGEFCETGSLKGATCGSLGFEGGVLSCNSTCSAYDMTRCVDGCGNGDVEGNEECDGVEHREGCHHPVYIGCGCDQFGLGKERVGCTPACRFDFSTCSGSPDYRPCGDGVVRDGEACDGENLAGKTCTGIGFDGGILSCKGDCTLNASACIGVGTCGDGVRRGAEACDGSDFDGLFCTSFGFEQGTMTCSDVCQVDTSLCSTCGNNVIEGNELCDGSELNGETCRSQGKPIGTLACNGNCTGFNTDGCEGF